MDFVLKHRDFKRIIKRKTPCIICIEDIKDARNIEIHKSINNLCAEFPLVLCYKINILDYNNYHLNRSIYKPDNLIRFQCGRIISVVDGNNYPDMYKLFWQVYAYSCDFNLEGYIKILTAEKRLPLQPKLYYDQKDLDFIQEKVCGIISEYLKYEKIEYPRPLFAKHKYSRHLIFKKQYNHPRNKILFMNGKKIQLLSSSTVPSNKIFPF